MQDLNISLIYNGKKGEFMYPIRKHKFGAKSCEMHGKKFSSKLEAEIYRLLEGLIVNKKILFVLRQTRFDLPGNMRHRVDFTVFTHDEVFFVEAKGLDLEAGRMRRKIVEDLYKIPIFVAKKPLDIYKILEKKEQVS